jgi:hypothetical protein
MELDQSQTLLAVDLGIRSGLALYGRDGRLRWYRSKNFGNTAQLRRGARTILAEQPELTWLILEGGGEIAEIWQREAEYRQILVHQISAEAWRQFMFYPRQQRTGIKAKQSADKLARRIIEWSGISRPTSLRHDAAEAILVGLWGVLEVGWLERLPAEIKF